MNEKQSCIPKPLIKASVLDAEKFIVNQMNEV